MDNATLPLPSPPASPLSRRRWLWRIGLVLGGLAVVWGLTWGSGQILLKREVTAWIEEVNRPGQTTLAYSALESDGFPWRFDLVFREARGTFADGASWSAPMLHLSFSPFDFKILRLMAPLGVRGTVPVKGAMVQGSAKQGQGELHFTALGMDAGTLTLDELSGETLGGEGITHTLAHLSATLRQTLPPPADHTGPSLSLSLDMTDLVLPAPPGPSSLPARIDSLALESRLMGPPPAPFAPNIAAWSRDGGTVELDKAALTWGPLTIAARGTLALDRKLQPLAALTADVGGFGPALEAMAAAGLIRPKDAMTARALLTGMSPRKPGEPLPPNPTVRLPLSLQGGFLLLGPFRLLALPPLVWPESAG